MKAAPPADAPSWDTSSYGQGTDTTPMQLSTLGEHLSHCTQPGGRLGALQRAGEALHGFVLGHLVTSATVVVLAAGAAWLMAS